MSSDNLIQIGFNQYFFPLTPNCLMTKKPIIFVGPRWQWGLIPNFISEHGYEVYCLESYYPTLIKKNQYHWLDIKEYRNSFHSYVPSVNENKFHRMSFLFESSFFPIFLKKAASYFFFVVFKNRIKASYQLDLAKETILPTIHNWAELDFIENETDLNKNNLAENF